MPKPFVFDKTLQAESRDARMDFLRRVIGPHPSPLTPHPSPLTPHPSWQSSLGLRTALDMGCGVGYFAAMLRNLGLQVTAADARIENIEEARERHPYIDFRVADIENASVKSLGTFDLVVCFGLLYHLENPLLAIRNLRAITGKLMLLESMSVPDEQPFLFLLDEPTGEDQSLRSVSCYPSEGAIIKMAYRAGFPNVYKFRELPAHEDFRSGIGRARARTVIAASVQALDSPQVEMATEPRPPGDLWTTDPTGITKVLRRLRRSIKKTRNRKRT